MLWLRLEIFRGFAATLERVETFGSDESLWDSIEEWLSDDLFCERTLKKSALFLA